MVGSSQPLWTATNTPRPGQRGDPPLGRARSLAKWRAQPRANLDQGGWTSPWPIPWPSVELDHQAGQVYGVPLEGSQLAKIGIFPDQRPCALDYESFRDVDMVIEAVIEELVYIPPIRQLLLLLLLVLILQEQLGAGLVQMLSRSLKKRGKRRIDYRVPSVSIEDACDAKEESAVYEPRQRLGSQKLTVASIS
nr:phosphatidylinositol/phosphatidylcholine transfer protein SFH13-like [Ipomoea batatas]